MDIKQDDFFEEVTQLEIVLPELKREEESLELNPASVKLPLPPEDFDDNGRVRKVRKRVLNKLLKCEFRYYLPVVCILSGIILVLGLVFGAALRNMMREEMTESEMIVGVFALLPSMLLYVIACGGTSVFMQIYPIVRYNKNFFQSEGYMTFSIPATAEEHVLAKRLGAIVGTFIVSVAMGISVVFIILFLGGFSEVWASMEMVIEVLMGEMAGDWGHYVLLLIEAALSGLVGMFLTPSLYGAASCLLSKISGGMKLALSILIVFFSVGCGQLVFSYVVTYGTAWISTPLGNHIYQWISIVVKAALTVACILFEIWYIKKRMDLR